MAITVTINHKLLVCLAINKRMAVKLANNQQNNKSASCKNSGFQMVTYDTFMFQEFANNLIKSNKFNLMTAL